MAADVVEGTLEAVVEEIMAVMAGSLSLYLYNRHTCPPKHTHN